MTSADDWFLYLDGDDVGAHIELHLLRNEVELAADVSRLVVIAIGDVADYLRTGLGAQIVFAAGDEVLAMVPKCPSAAEVESARRQFYTTTGLSISCGVGRSSKDAADHLRLAKLQGKDRTAGITQS